ncbi:MAG: LysM peptidoglycan-binding domain-containing protein [Eubacteriales bacterium]
MNLTPMRYRDFIWPHNPRIYSIEYEKVIATNKVPYGLYHLQDMGRTRRVMRGEGEFIGPTAHNYFGALANTFYEEGSGTLIHPLWQTSDAFMVELKLEQVPRPDYVKYSFVFWENYDRYDDSVTTISGSSSVGSVVLPETTQATIHTVVAGDTLWGIARKYGLGLEGLVALNPQIKNINLIYVGQEVKLA